MYYLAKLAQATGLTITAWGFIAAFPTLMNMRTLTIGVILFAFGWIIEIYLLKK